MTKHSVIKVITGYVFSCLVTAGWGQTEGPTPANGTTSNGDH